MHILFVCTGNTCRSPMAMVLGRQIFTDHNFHAEVRSAGVAVFTPMQVSAHAMAAMAARGLSLEGYCAQQVDEAMLTWADLVFTMTAAHAAYLKELSPQNGAKIYSLCEYVGENCELTDPYGQPLAVYEKCAKDLQIYIEKAANKINESKRKGEKL